ncbi:hypothetical protein AURDEDRAFT_182899 [Auricularia subglabra TFB-10046 SS5]|nr:hypothetical protein AURDEDRAFT_182899 [Auricularia subglabra TFB-10046 SS5]
MGLADCHPESGYPMITSTDEVAFEAIAFRLATRAFNQGHGGKEDLQVQDSIFAIAQRGIARASRRRNAQMLVESVPTEIFGMIFGYLDLQSCIVASHVCHRWRSIAIGMPWLWCNFNTRHGGASLLQELLSRTKPWPVSIRIPRLTRAMEIQLAEHVSHIKSLQLKWVHNDAGAWLCLPCPALEKLHIAFRAAVTFNLTRTFFPERHVFPVLRDLSFRIYGLENYDLPALLSMCPALRRLELDLYPSLMDHGDADLGLTQSITSCAPLLDEVRIWANYDVLGNLLPYLQSVRDLRVGPVFIEDPSPRGDELVITPLLHNVKVQQVAVVSRDGLERRKQPEIIAIWARSPTHSRMLVPPTWEEIHWVLSNDSVTEHLASVVLVSDQWRSAFPLPAAPALQTLTLLLHHSHWERPSILPRSGPNAPQSAVWDCPALHTVCIGCAEGRDPGHGPTVPADDLHTVLTTVLGFSSTRKLRRLVLMNAAVLDGSGVRKTRAPPDHAVFAVVDKVEYLENPHWDGIEL